MGARVDAAPAPLDHATLALRVLDPDTPAEQPVLATALTASPLSAYPTVATMEARQAERARRQEAREQAAREKAAREKAAREKAKRIRAAKLRAARQREARQERQREARARARDRASRSAGRHRGSRGGWRISPKVTWYGPGFYGNGTACGQRYTRTIIGVAHRTLPCGTLVQFRWGGKTATAPVIDRGPYGHPGYHFDWSARLACVVFKPRNVRNGCFTRSNVAYRVVGRVDLDRWFRRH
jgi:rare lipoprotein A (peptidoglycan hydrolase)